jgi:hypothetical protein
MHAGQRGSVEDGHRALHGGACGPDWHAERKSLHLSAQEPGNWHCFLARFPGPEQDITKLEMLAVVPQD